MTSLWLALVALLICAIAFVMWPLWRYRKASISAALNEDEVDVRLNENVRIFHEHLSELENSLSSQAINQEQFAQLKLELERNLLDDEASLRSLHKNSSQRLGVKFVLAFFTLIFIAGVFFYQKHGSANDVKIHALQEEKIQQDWETANPV
ncbi:MAG: c-type cytochrome biogenesis protein CcmI, partial [Moraxellaceae bacterium]